MTTTTQAGTITLAAAELRAILATLDEFTTSDKTKHALTLARVTPLVIEQTADDETRPTGLVWEATDSYALVSIAHRVKHDLTGSALIDPAAILATMPKKSDAKPDSVLNINGMEWQHTNGHNTSTGTITDAHWPTTLGLWHDQRDALAPHTVGAFQLARLAKAAKHLGTDQVNAASMAHTNDQPDPRRPIVYTITGDNIEARCLLMPARRR